MLVPCAVVIVRRTPWVVRVFWSKPQLGAWESTVTGWSAVLDDRGECSLPFHIARECFGAWWCNVRRYRSRNELVASKLILQGCLTTISFGKAPWSGKLHNAYELLRRSSHESSILWHRVSYCTDAGNSCANMPESSCLDKNDELIDSIAKATLAATSVIGVPWRRRTMDSWELAFGSNAGLIPFKSCCMDSPHKSFYVWIPN